MPRFNGKSIRGPASRYRNMTGIDIGGGGKKKKKKKRKKNKSCGKRWRVRWRLFYIETTKRGAGGRASQQRQSVSRRESETRSLDGHDDDGRSQSFDTLYRAGIG